MSGTPWETILRYFQTTSRPVEICIGCSADAAAACKTLTDLLSTFLVAVAHHPIDDYATLASIAASHRANNEETTKHLYILIGMGAAVDLKEFFNLDTDTVIVLDSYRPMHLTNLRREGESLLIWGSSRIRTDIDTIFAKLSKKSRKRGRAKGGADGEDSDSSDSSNSDEDDDDEEDEEEDAALAIDWMGHPESVTPELEALYCAAEYRGKSSACEVRDLSVFINHHREQYCWNAAIGVTDLFLRRGMDVAAFFLEMAKLRDVVNQINATKRSNLADLTNAGARRPTHEVKLCHLDDDQLFLLRHWTLWDAVWHDKNLASLFGLHHVDDGAEKLRFVFAKCGISVKRAQQGWMEIPLEERQQCMRLLRQEIRDVASKSAPHAHRYQSMLPSIGRSAGFSTIVSTFDACHLFNAMSVVAPSPNVMNVATATDATGLHPNDRPPFNMMEFRCKTFWSAYAVLQSDPHSPNFTQAVQECKVFQKSVATATSALMQRGSVLTTRAVHYSLLNDANHRTVALDSFWMPQRLRLLGEHLLLALAVERDGKRHRMKPLLLSTCSTSNSNSSPASPALDQFVVVCCHEGVIAVNSVLPIVKHFNETALLMRAHLRQSNIDRNCIVVSSRERATHFCEDVHLRAVVAKPITTAVS